MSSLAPRDRKQVFVYLFAAAVSLPLGYLIVSWSVNTYSFLSLYRPEQLFEEAGDPATPRGPKGVEILEALNAEIEQDSSVKQVDENWLLAHVDQLWNSVRRYVAPSDRTRSLERMQPRAPLRAEKPGPAALSARTEPGGSTSGGNSAEKALQSVLSLSADPKVLGRASRGSSHEATPVRRPFEPFLRVSSKALGSVGEAHGQETAEWLYRFESLKGVGTQSVIYQFTRNLALEGTVEAQPRGETDPDLSDFGFRTVHALNFLRDLPTPSLTMGYEGIHSGYPLSYGIGLNYRVSPLVNLRFDYSYETPHEELVEYRGTWESSLMTNYDKTRAEDSLSVHNFFFGLRYLCQDKEARIPLHTGFFYSTNMDDEPLSSNVSLGFSIGGGIHRRDLHMGFAWRFRIWDNPEQQFLDKQEIRELDTRVSNQFLFTLLF